MRLLTVLIILIAFSHAQAAIPLVHNGVPGVWMSADEAERRLKELEQSRKLIAAQDDLIAQQKMTIQTATTALEASLNRELASQEIINDLASRPNNGIFWTSIGVVLGAGLVGLGALVSR